MALSSMKLNENNSNIEGLEMNKNDSHNMLEEIQIAMQQDFYFPIFDRNGNFYLSHTQDISTEALKRLFLEREFVELVKKTKGPVFSFEKTIQGTKLLSESSLAKRFYELLSFPSGKIPEGFEPSENVNILRETIKRLNLQSLELSGNPMSVVGQSGVLEGEIVNSLITRLRESITSKSYKTAFEERKRLCFQAVHGTRRKIKRIVENRSVFIVRMDCSCPPDGSGVRPLAEMQELHGRFIQSIQSDPALRALLGVWWLRDFLSEIGHRYHSVIIFDAANGPNGLNVAPTVGDHWNSVTDGKGICFQHFPCQDNYRSWGAGYLPAYSPNEIEILLHSTKMMLSRDLYLRPKLWQKSPHFGMLQLPQQARSVGDLHRSSAPSPTCTVGSWTTSNFPSPNDFSRGPGLSRPWPI